MYTCSHALHNSHGMPNAVHFAFNHAVAASLAAAGPPLFLYEKILFMPSPGSPVRAVMQLLVLISCTVGFLAFAGFTAGFALATLVLQQAFCEEHLLHPLSWSLQQAVFWPVTALSYPFFSWPRLLQPSY